MHLFLRSVPRPVRRAVAAAVNVRDSPLLAAAGARHLLVRTPAAARTRRRQATLDPSALHSRPVGD